MVRTRVITSYLDEKAGTVERCIERLDGYNETGRMDAAYNELEYLEGILKAMLQEVDKELTALDGGERPTSKIVPVGE